jgi:quinol monooxygenase YgiN
MLIQIFVNTARTSASNGRCIAETAPPLVSALAGTTPGDRRNYPVRLAATQRTQWHVQKKVAFRSGHIMAGSPKIVVARVYPKPGRLQEVIDVYARIVPLVYQEPGCELFALHTDGETVFVVEKWATPADLQGHAAGPAYAQIRAGISDLVDHAPDVWILDPLSFGEAAKGTIGPAPITNRHAEGTA